MSMKASLHSGRKMSAKHNDRSYESEIYDDSHIDKSLTKNNVYYTAENGKMSHSALRIKGCNLERDYMKTYADLFGEANEKQNQKYINGRKPEKCRSIEDWYKSARKSPRETIFQIGKHGADEAVTKKVLECVEQLQREYEERFPENYKCLGWAFHADEVEYGTDHVHLNDVLMYKNDDGILEPAQDKALQQMGYEPPNKNEKIGKYNNRVQAFTAEQRARFIEICREHGIEIDDKVTGKATHQETRRDIAILEEKKNALENDLNAKTKALYKEFKKNTKADEIELKIPKIGNKTVAQVNVADVQKLQKKASVADALAKQMQAEIERAEDVRKELNKEIMKCHAKEYELNKKIAEIGNPQEKFEEYEAEIKVLKSAHARELSEVKNKLSAEIGINAELRNDKNVLQNQLYAAKKETDEMRVAFFNYKQSAEPYVKAFAEIVADLKKVRSGKINIKTVLQKWVGDNKTKDKGDR